jgi:(E)-4-hydroxy-3-methylbut-2-enyl-diphosphate synthase
VYVDGKLSTTLRGDGIVAEFRGILDSYVARRYAKTLADSEPLELLQR